MKMKNAAGLQVSGADVKSLAILEQAMHELRCYIGDPLATIDRALERSPELVMAHAAKAYIHLLGTEPQGIALARAAHEQASAFPATSRERRHLHAIRELASGHWRSAGRVLEDLSIDFPLDALALQVGHQIDFFTGDARMLRDRIARALPAWDSALPGFHSLLSMHAFGLEETGDYSRAESQGRAAVELEPRDGWGQHAVAHVMEMQRRPRDGIRWMRDSAQVWSHESFFAVHNWWHLALFHLALNELDEVLELFDRRIYANQSKIVLELIDASAMLWRLHLRGVDVGNRWTAVAHAWEPHAAAGPYAFNDMHAMMAFVGAGREKTARVLLETQPSAMHKPGDNASFTREVGDAATRAIFAFGTGDYAEAVRLLRPIRSYAHRFGGSHAQRDVLDLTLIEAARRAGQERLVHALGAERSAAVAEPFAIELRPLPARRRVSGIDARATLPVSGEAKAAAIEADTHRAADAIRCT